MSYARLVRRIWVTLDGGIGNLLFQYAAALTLLDSSQYNVGLREASPGLVERLASYVGHFDNVELKLCANGDRIGQGSNFSTVRRLSRQFSVLPLAATTKWTPSFSPRPSSIPFRVQVVRGYFQHRSWYEDSMNKVLGQLKMQAASARTVVPPNLTAVHLRRSDYVRLGWDLPVEYYSKALSGLSLAPDEPVVVLSDDHLVQVLFEEHLEKRGYRVFRPNSSSAREDFFLIAAAKNIVMSNSTFSWWAVKLATYSRSDSPRIICPHRWIDDPQSLSLIERQWEIVDF